ncbi:RtcB family protein [Pseudomonas sp. LS44]|uniref:RtcB family protein n=1 Tax=Pseudomonas sp. LS44 TaxID=1357074 RepID=UPI00215AC2E2|nr:RtcB family protein [Pseudomonas sp. LS44]UVE17128.1 RtcB family protein [Pseudomonas sp. LS44]
MKQSTFQLLEVAGGKPIKLWTDGVPVEDEARRQLQNTAKLPFIFKHIAVMPDVHVGKGSTIGSVIPTIGAIIPAAVGVDIGCGMIAARTSLTAADLPDNLHGLRRAIEQAVPHGKTFGKHDSGAWQHVPGHADQAWRALAGRFRQITDKYPRLEKTNNRSHLGTLGTGNHFIEVCLDEAQCVWFMLHSGSRGVGNAIGTLFIELAQADMRQHLANLPDRDLAYFEEGSRHFADYVEAVEWAQDFARQNRALMMQAVIGAARQVLRKPFEAELEAVNCHHNYVQREQHFGREVLVTRKGAVSAQRGQLGIIPGSMGTQSFIVRGLGNEEAFCSCSHGAGRVMSRSQARKRFSLEDQVRATAHVECRKDKEVIDEIPMAYKNIDAVMAAQRELVEVVHTLRQVVCVKG